MKTKAKYQRLIDAKYLYDYLIEVTFEDHTTRVIDLENFFKSSKFPCVRRYAPLEKFKQFHLDEYNVLCWGDNECDIDSFDIYQGMYDARLEYA
jgi:hypothetical protein